MKPELWSLGELKRTDLGKTVAWTRPYLEGRVRDELKLSVINDIEEIPEELDTLVAIGGGVLMDRAKIWRKEKRPKVRLICIPSIWGSGAENSPVVVINEDVRKVIHIG